MANEHHVVPHANGWAVRAARNTRTTSAHPTQREAIAEACRLARRRGGELFVHSHTGRLRRWDTARRNDAMPPRG